LILDSLFNTKRVFDIPWAKAGQNTMGKRFDMTCEEGGATFHCSFA
jgi:hypothetical protein